MEEVIRTNIYATAVDSLFTYGQGRKWLCMWNLIVHVPDSFPKPYELEEWKDIHWPRRHE